MENRERKERERYGRGMWFKKNLHMHWNLQVRKHFRIKGSHSQRTNRSPVANAQCSQQKLPAIPAVVNAQYSAFSEKISLLWKTLNLWVVVFMLYNRRADQRLQVVPVFLRLLKEHFKTYAGSRWHNINVQQFITCTDVLSPKFLFNAKQSLFCLIIQFDVEYCVEPG